MLRVRLLLCNIIGVKKFGLVLVRCDVEGPVEFGWVARSQESGRYLQQGPKLPLTGRQAVSKS